MKLLFEPCDTFLGIVALVTVVMVHPKQYCLNEREFFIRGGRYPPARFSGFSVDEFPGFRILILRCPDVSDFSRR